jgi:hypothetical protein
VTKLPVCHRRTAAVALACVAAAGGDAPRSRRLSAPAVRILASYGPGGAGDPLPTPGRWIIQAAIQADGTDRLLAEVGRLANVTLAHR